MRINKAFLEASFISFLIHASIILYLLGFFYFESPKKAFLSKPIEVNLLFEDTSNKKQEVIKEISKSNDFKEDISYNEAIPEKSISFDSLIKNIKIDEFNALIKITVEMCRYLYPYIRRILQSKEGLEKDSVIWNDFKNRFVELIKERFNADSMRVKKLLNQTENDEIIIKSLLTLSLCISNQGYQKLKNFLLDF